MLGHRSIFTATLAATMAALGLGGCATVVPATWKAVPDGEAMADAYPGFADMPRVFATGYMVAFAECAAMAVIAGMPSGEERVR